jgi:hypothetical protein
MTQNKWVTENRSDQSKGQGRKEYEPGGRMGSHNFMQSIIIIPFHLFQCLFLRYFQTKIFQSFFIFFIHATCTFFLVNHTINIHDLLLSQWLYVIQSSQSISHMKIHLVFNILDILQHTVFIPLSRLSADTVCDVNGAVSRVRLLAVSSPSADRSENKIWVITIHVPCCLPIGTYHKEGPTTSNMYGNDRLPESDHCL